VVSNGRMGSSPISSTDQKKSEQLF